MNSWKLAASLLTATTLSLAVPAGRLLAGPIQYQVTDLGVRASAGLNDAGQVAFTDSTTYQVHNGGGLSGRGVEPITVSVPTIYNSYGPNASQVLSVMQPIPSFQPTVPYKPGAVDTGIARGIDAQGRVLVQTYSHAADGSSYYFTDGTTATPVNIPSGTGGTFQAASGNGQLVFHHYNSTAQDQNSIVNGNTVTDLGHLMKGSQEQTVAINNVGQVIGTSNVILTNSPYQHSFLYSNGTMTDIPQLPNHAAKAWNDNEYTVTAKGLNDTGQVVGSAGYVTGTNNGDATQHAFLFSQGVMKDIGTALGNLASYANAINNKGEIVGSFTDTNGVSHAALFENGQVFDLNKYADKSIPWGVVLTSAIRINNNGQILAEGHFANPSNGPYSSYWSSSTYLLTPEGLPTPGQPTNLPEPGTWVIFAVAAAAVGLRQRRRA